MLIRPAWGAREPCQSGVSRADFLHLDKDMPGNPILGPLPRKPCAAGMTLCLTAPSSITLTQYPSLAPGEGRRRQVQGNCHQVPGPCAANTEGTARVPTGRLCLASSPTAVGPAKWAPYVSGHNTPHSGEPRAEQK